MRRFSVKKIPLERLLMGGLSILFFLFSLILIKTALMGDFRTSVFGVQYQYMWDPGGPYLSSGVFFFRSHELQFYGHPGFFLQLIVGVVSECAFFLAKASGCAAGYAECVIKNYPNIIFTVKMIITLCHIITFYIIKSISTRFVPKMASFIAAFAYASAYPVIYYIDNIAPEPILVLCVTGAVLFVYKYMEALKDGRMRLSYAYVPAIAFSSVAACFSKFMFGVPFSFAVLLYFVVINFKIIRSSTATSIKQTALYLISASAFFLMLSEKINWPRFFNFWFRLSPGGKNIDSNETALNKFFHMIVAYFEKDVLPLLSVEKWIPNAYSKQGLFFLSETLFLVIGAWGAWMIFKSRSADLKIKLLLLVLISLCIAPIVQYRGDFHYYFIYIAFASVLSSFTLHAWAGKYLTSGLGERKALVMSMIFICLIHFSGFITLLNGKIYNAKIYAKNYEAYYSALSRIDYDEKIATDGKIKDIITALPLKYETGPSVNALRNAAQRFMIKVDAEPDEMPDNVPFFIKRTKKGVILKEF